MKTLERLPGNREKVLNDTKAETGGANGNIIIIYKLGTLYKIIFTCMTTLDTVFQK
jgi:hypothetical protein